MRTANFRVLSTHFCNESKTLTHREICSSDEHQQNTLFTNWSFSNLSTGTKTVWTLYIQQLILPSPCASSPSFIPELAYSSFLEFPCRSRRISTNAPSPLHPSSQLLLQLFGGETSQRFFSSRQSRRLFPFRSSAHFIRHRNWENGRAHLFKLMGMGDPRCPPISRVNGQVTGS